jgi:riboflavin synthase alpha subunit
LESYLKAGNNISGMFYGDTVATDGVHIVVGAPLEPSSQTTISNTTTSSTNTSEANAGAVFIYSAK